MSEKNLYIGEGLLIRFEERQVSQTSRVASFTILLPERPPADGQERRNGTFVPVEVWDMEPSLVQLLSRSVKNCRVFVKGRLKLDQFTDKNGADRQKLKVIADRVAYVPMPPRQEQQPQQQQFQQQRNLPPQPDQRQNTQVQPRQQYQQPQQQQYQPVQPVFDQHGNEVPF